MLRTETATPSSFTDVLPLLSSLGKNNPHIGETHWRSLFEYHWTVDEEARGFILFEEEKAVGFMGATFSNRVVSGKKHRFCNINSWVVLPEFRNHALALMMPILEMSGHTITCMTPSPHVHDLLVKFGFEVLETEETRLFEKIVRPLPGLPNALLRRKATITNRSDEIAPHLDADQKRILADHPQCEHLLVRRAEETCYCVMTTTSSWRFNYSVIHHVSNPRLFLDTLGAVRYHVWRRFGALRFSADRRLFQGLRHRAMSHTRLTNSRLCKSPLEPKEIDNLYSELVLLPLY